VIQSIVLSNSQGGWMSGSVLGIDGRAVWAKLARERTHYGVRRECSGA
jgi:phosphate-selective porin